MNNRQPGFVDQNEESGFIVGSASSGDGVDNGDVTDDDVYNDELQFGESGVLPVGPAVESETGFGDPGPSNPAVPNPAASIDRTVLMPARRSGYPYATEQPREFVDPAVGPKPSIDGTAAQGGRKLTRIAIALVILAALLVAGSVACEYVQPAFQNLAASWNPPQSASQTGQQADPQPGQQPDPQTDQQPDLQAPPPASNVNPVDATHTSSTATGTAASDNSPADAGATVTVPPAQPNSPVDPVEPVGPDETVGPVELDGPNAPGGDQSDAGTTVTNPSDDVPIEPDVPGGVGAPNAPNTLDGPDTTDNPGVTVTPPSP